MHELWIKNRSERDLCSCEEIVAKKAQKKKPRIFFWAFLATAQVASQLQRSLSFLFFCVTLTVQVSVLSKHLMSKVFASKGELLFFCCLHNHVVSCHSFLLFSIAVQRK